MQCSVCHKNLASTHIMEVENLELAKEQYVCAECAESAGYVHAKSTPLKISAEMLEDLIGGMKSGIGAPTDTGAACPACGLALTDFLAKGRLGCPRCYEAFRKNLLDLLERVHDGTSHRGKRPGKSARLAGENDTLADLRSSLRDAINAENYELAARLRDKLSDICGEEGLD